MNGGRWFTKEDVQNDLARTGFRVPDFEEEYIVRGEKPPPPPRHINDQDDTFELMFGGLGYNVHNTAPSTEPDLLGITNMLRMVNDASDKENSDNNDDQPSTRIVISKLNPFVKEFVPQTVKQNLTKDNKNDSKSNNNNVENDKTGLAADTCDSESHEKLKIETMLKNKIKEMSKANTLKAKRARNVAITALLNLNSISSAPGSPKKISNLRISPSENSNSSNQEPIPPSPKPLVLLSPEYFEIPRGPAVIVNIDNDENSIPTTSIQQDKSETTISSKDSISKDKVNATSTPNSAPHAFSPAENPSPIDTETQESINKVNDWFERPIHIKSKAKAPQMGPMVFVKKNSSTASSVSDTVKQTISNTAAITTAATTTAATTTAATTTATTTTAVTATPSFVPSKYAMDLAKNFEERAKARASQGLDMWTKLELDLKVRDEKIKQANKLAGSRICPTKS